LVDLYHRADCFINASLYEGISNSMLEAMACGLPVVASNVSGNNELVIDGETGYLFDLSLPDRCGDSLVRLAADRSLAVRLGTQARRRVATMFSWNRVSDEYLSFFNRQQRDPPYALHETI
jgi:glycosyltransferase involved in cell wall biosynthesis